MLDDNDERQMYQTMLHHFAMRLNEERAHSADLVRQIECLRERINWMMGFQAGLFEAVYQD
jgi:hypothetical protein